MTSGGSFIHPSKIRIGYKIEIIVINKIELSRR